MLTTVCVCVCVCVCSEWPLLSTKPLTGDTNIVPFEPVFVPEPSYLDSSQLTLKAIYTNKICTQL